MDGMQPRNICLVGLKDIPLLCFGIKHFPNFDFKRPQLYKVE